LLIINIYFFSISYSETVETHSANKLAMM